MEGSEDGMGSTRPGAASVKLDLEGDGKCLVCWEDGLPAQTGKTGPDLILAAAKWPPFCRDMAAKWPPIFRALRAQEGAATTY